MRTAEGNTRNMYLHAHWRRKQTVHTHWRMHRRNRHTCSEKQRNMCTDWGIKWVQLILKLPTNSQEMTYERVELNYNNNWRIARQLNGHNTSEEACPHAKPAPWTAQQATRFTTGTVRATEKKQPRASGYRFNGNCEGTIGADPERGAGDTRRAAASIGDGKASAPCERSPQASENKQ